MTAKRSIGARSVNPVGLGCMSLSWAYGTPPARADAVALLNRSLDCGYDHLDTANIYGLGHNETLLGEALKGRRQAFFLASKMGLVVDGPNRGVDCSPAAIARCINESLARLQTDHIDLFYMHRRDFAVPIEESMGAMAALVQAGKIGAIGLSEMSAETLRRAHSVHPVAALQTEYSPWTRNPEIAVLETCRELGTTFVAFSPVGRGALAGAVRDLNALPERDIRRAMPRFQGEAWVHNLGLIDAFNALAVANGLTPAQLSLGWVLAQGEHVVAIPGTTVLAHLEENAASGVIAPDLAVQIDALINQASVAGPRYSAAMQRTIETEEFA